MRSSASRRRRSKRSSSGSAICWPAGVTISPTSRSTWTQSAFNLRVYAIARAINPGDVSTYGEVAKAMGEPGAARAVGKALGENPWPIVVPCHRVLAASQGKRGAGMGGFSAPGGAETKARLLTIERAKTNAIPTLFDLEFSVAPPRRG
jgi:methylated-DNA-[protein]-cysteine S-methyltransferase